MGVARKIKLEIVGDEQIQMSVVVVVQERAAGVVAHAILLQAGLGGDILEPVPAPIAIENIRAPISDEQIGVAVVVEVARRTRPVPSRYVPGPSALVTSANLPFPRL